MKRRQRILNILISLMILTGCAGSRQTESGRNNPKGDGYSSIEDSSWVYPPLQVEDISALDTSPPHILDKIPSLDMSTYTPDQQTQEKTDLFETKDSEPVTVSGYRVQIFAGQDQKSAQSFKSSAEENLAETIYLVYEAPQYKVRIGNYEDREKASQFCELIRAQGYRDAWVVKSLIEVHH